MNASVQHLWMAYCLDPSEGRFADFYSATRGYVYTICYRVLHGDEEEAVDAFQATYTGLIALAQNRPEAERVEDIDLLVRRLAVREADKRRKRKTRRGHREVAVEHLETLADSRPTADRITASEQIRSVVERLVEALPDAYRIPVQLHYFNGMTHQEIAETLGMGRSTVTKQIQKALHRLKPLMRNAGLGEATLALGAILATAELVQPPASLAASTIVANSASLLAYGATGFSALPPSPAQILSQSFPFSTGGGAGATVKGAVIATAVAAGLATLLVLSPWSPPSNLPAPPISQPAGQVSRAGPLAGQTADPTIGAGQKVSGTPGSPSAADGKSLEAPKESGSQYALPGPPQAGGAPDEEARVPSRLVAGDDAFTTGPRIRVAGRVSYPGGRAAAGATVALLRTDEKGASGTELVDRMTSSGLDGDYSLEALDRPGLLVRAWTGLLTQAERRLPDPPAPQVLNGEGGSAKAGEKQTDRDLRRDLALISRAAVQGRVLDAKGRTLAGAEIRAVGVRDGSPRNEWPLQTRTGQEGEFLLDVSRIRWGAVRVAAFSEGFRPESLTASIPSEGLEFRLAPGGVVVEGRVFRKTDGRPVAGAKVRAVAVSEEAWGDARLPAFETVSSGLGEFRLSGLPSGWIVLEAEKDDLRSIPAESPEAYRLGLGDEDRREGISLLLRQTHFLAGRITDGFGNPVEGVRVSIFSPDEAFEASGRTDSTGRYRFDELSSAPVSLDLRHDDYEARQVAQVEVDRGDADFTLETSRRVTLIATVVDGKTGQPVGEFSVEGDDGSRPEPDRSAPGRFTAAGLVPGRSYRFRIRAEGYAERVSEAVRAPAGETVFRHTFSLGPGGDIAGRVISLYTKEPLPGVRVAVSAPEGFADAGNSEKLSVLTDGEGRFRLTGVGMGTWRVRVQPETPWVEKRVEAVVDDEATAEVGDVELNRLGTVRGRVVEMPGEVPVVGQKVELRTAFDPAILTQTTGPQGEFEFADLRWVLYSLYLLDHDWLVQRARLDKGDLLDVTVPFGNGVIEGRVFRENRPCAETAQVRLLSPDVTFTRLVNTDASGRYVLNEIPSGRWRLEAFPRVQTLMGQTVVEFVDLEAGQTIQKDFALPSALLVGRLLSPAGEAVGGAKIEARPRDPHPSRVNAPTRPVRTHTGDDGSFEIAGLVPGAYDVFAEAKGKTAAVSQRIVLPFEGQSPEVVLHLQEEETGSLESVALDYMSRKPLQAAWCRLFRINADGPRVREAFVHSAERNAEGVMRIAGIPAGRYEVEVSAFGYSIARHHVEILAGGKATLDDVLHEAGALRWTLSDPAGLPIEGVRCRLVPQDPASIEEPREGVTDAQGTFTARGLLPGVYAATAERDGGRASELFTIHAHDVTQRITVFLPGTASASAGGSSAD